MAYGKNITTRKIGNLAIHLLRLEKRNNSGKFLEIIDKNRKHQTSYIRSHINSYLFKLILMSVNVTELDFCFCAEGSLINIP